MLCKGYANRCKWMQMDANAMQMDANETFFCLSKKKAIEQKKQSPRLKLNKLNKTFRRPRGRRSAAQPGTTPPIRSSDRDSIKDSLRNPLKHNSSELLLDRKLRIPGSWKKLINSAERPGCFFCLNKKKVSSSNTLDCRFGGLQIWKLGVSGLSIPGFISYCSGCPT